MNAKMHRLIKGLFVCSVVAVLFSFGSDSQAWVRGKNPAPTGRVQVNGFDSQGQSFAFLNFLKNSTGIASSGGYAFPSILDANGYPTTTPATAISIPGVVIPLSSIYSGAYVLKNANVNASNVASGVNGTFKVTLTGGSGTITVVSDYNGSASGSGTGTLTVSGTNPRVVFTFAGLPDTGNGNTLTMQWPASGTWSGVPDIALIRADQEALFDAGEIFNPFFISQLKEANPVTLRLLNWSAVSSTVNSQFDYRAPIAAASYRVARWEPRAWVGDITNGGSGIAFTAAASSGWAGLIDGALIQGVMRDVSPALITVSGSANNGSGLIRLTLDASTLSTGQRIAYSSGSTANGAGVWTITVIDSTHIDLQNSSFQSSTTGTVSVGTLNVAGTGAKILARSGGTPTWAVNDLVTVMYDAVTDAYYTIPRGIGDDSSVGAVPIEIQVALANKINSNLWINIPFQYTNSSIQSLVAYVAANLNWNLTAYYEFSNEVWNSAFTQNGYAYQRGQALGFLANRGDGYGNPQQVDYYGLRSRQIFGYVESGYAAVAKANYQRVLAVQLFGPSQLYQKYAFNGYDLAPLGVATGVGNATYTAFTGGADYTTFPNRPIDHADSIAVAPYSNGAQIASPRNGQNWATGVTTGGPSGWTTGLVGAADAYATGGAGNIENAFNFVDWDLSQGTRNGSVPSPDLTLRGMAATFARWNTLAAGYDAQRGGGGLSPLVLDQYEGGISPAMAPTTSDCLAMGIDSTTYCGSAALPNSRIYNLLLAYKQSSHFEALVKISFDDFRALNHARYVSWYAVQGVSATTPTSVWSAFVTGTYPPNIYASWTAIRKYNAP